MSIAAPDGVVRGQSRWRRILLRNRQKVNQQSGYFARNLTIHLMAKIVRLVETTTRVGAMTGLRLSQPPATLLAGLFDGHDLAISDRAPPCKCPFSMASFSVPPGCTPHFLCRLSVIRPRSRLLSATEGVPLMRAPLQSLRYVSRSSPRLPNPSLTRRASPARARCSSCRAASVRRRRRTSDRLSLTSVLGSEGLQARMPLLGLSRLPVAVVLRDGLSPLVCLISCAKERISFAFGRPALPARLSASPRPGRQHGRAAAAQVKEGSASAVIKARR
jgi:hypothetical protein